MAPVIVVPKSAFRLVRGDLKYHAVTGDSGNEVGRGFCTFAKVNMPTRLQSRICHFLPLGNLSAIRTYFTHRRC